TRIWSPDSGVAMGMKEYERNSTPACFKSKRYFIRKVKSVRSDMVNILGVSEGSRDGFSSRSSRAGILVFGESGGGGGVFGRLINFETRSSGGETWWSDDVISLSD